ncbi:MAG TPA: response regulator transcription factor [Hymenobacter sp.]|uniref:response regulator transcription factor n=1 Tax=Hymenobacter sp. TaxID=1898978 RepID=UPI002D801A8B|nr:response regulator transcription factor [Hymenobacter sp.]HET9504634.1 response regulator transcription factor [Hymenobacter sp.]
MPDIRIIHYEDNRELREGLAFLIQATPGLELVGSFANCQRIGEEVRALRPDIALMDIDLPGISGIEAVPLVKAAAPAAQVLMLTVFDDDDKIFRAIRHGASGYLLKHTAPGEIMAALVDLHRGGSPMTASIARRVLRHFQAPAAPAEDYRLSPRELDIVKGLVAGYSYKLIASDLFISIETVRSHIRSIYEKLHVNSKTEAVLKAMREGLV